MRLVGQRADPNPLNSHVPRPRPSGNHSLGLLALIGPLNVIGTIASGWLTDRVFLWPLLVIYYGQRGISPLTVDSLLGPTVEPFLWIFLLFYGLDWVAKVPPTVVPYRQYFGSMLATVVFVAGSSRRTVE